MKPAEEYILNQPEPYRSIVLHLQMVIERTLPNVELKYKWNIPCFYAGKSPICYVNVSQKKHFVDLGFWNSAHLNKHSDVLVSEKRKVVRSLRYASLEDVDDVVLTDVLKEALSVRNDGFYKRKDLD
ncbi:MAG: DUF1801 domain-containing protein [Maribacter sp.]